MSSDEHGIGEYRAGELDMGIERTVGASSDNERGNQSIGGIGGERSKGNLSQGSKR